MIKRRETNQRRLILQVVQGRCDHPTADSIYEAVHAKDARISRGTVYRNLGLLSEEGDVYHVRAPGADRYDLRTDPHDHIICVLCKRVVDAPSACRPSPDAQIAAATGYRILCHQTIYEGLCPDCQSATDATVPPAETADTGSAGN